MVLPAALQKNKLCNFFDEDMISQLNRDFLMRHDCISFEAANFQTHSLNTLNFFLFTMPSVLQK